MVTGAGPVVTGAVTVAWPWAHRDGMGDGTGDVMAMAPATKAMDLKQQSIKSNCTHICTARALIVLQALHMCTLYSR